ncbi:MAG TPA: hypothetical protein VKZ95_03735, partial [Sphingobacteriaceae bacterium]|nr:hypothetical protein [Sphingobacteriaceae bacterium]
LRPDLVEGSSQYGRVPTYNYQMKSDLRPEEEQQLRQQFIDKKINPKVQDNLINRIREDIKTRYNEMKTNYGMDVAREKQIQDKWAVFKAQSDENLQPLLGRYNSRFGFGGRPRTSNDLKNKYFQYAGNLPVNLTPEQMHAQAGAMLQNDIDRIDAVAALPEMPFIRNPHDVEDYLNDKKDAYKELVNEGFYESIKEDSVNKGMGIEELHNSIWGDQTNKASLNSLSIFQAPIQDFNEPKRGEKNLFGFGKDFSKESLLKPFTKKINPNYVKEKKQYIENISSQLERIKPEDDLILLRSQVLNSGGTEKDFMDALTKAQEKKLQLSPFQRSQLQELRIPRVRPLWEIFNPKTWNQWINYLSGRR